ncbi:MAG TPA: aminopeptidase P family protein, partial [Pyrinomonadaceae bacterium]|nr:aminopeptidase P family protein [Pyrinomonadaceae bacterium]
MRVKTVFGAALLACVAALCLVGLPVENASARVAKANVIRETPPAPAFTDEERVAELRARRARAAERVGKNALLVMFSAEPRVYANDVDYEFRQENNLYYLTNLRQRGATLVMLPGATEGPREILFIPQRNAAAETWTGHMYSPEEVRAASGVEEIWEAKEFEPFMRSLRGRRAYRPQKESILASTFNLPAVAAPPSEAARQPPGPPPPPSGLDGLFAAMNQYDAALYLVLPGGENSREYRQEQEFASTWAKSAVGLNVRTAWPIFAELRMRKTPYELALMQHAIDISIEGHQRAQAVASRTQWEYETEAELDYTFKRRNADNWGYPNIVGCGPSGTTLHYQESSARVRPGDLILIDAGAEYQHYSADVTRTFPVNGKFTKEQAEIYNIVLAAQEAAFKATRPGVYLSDVHNAALEVVKDGLLKLGLITDKNSDQYRVWFMHGTSHFLGMNVHDINVRGAKLDAGMVFTVEPGIYIRPDALEYLPKTPEYERFAAAVRPAFEKYKSTGVRIEDDVLVTPDGYKNMSSALART